MKIYFAGAVLVWVAGWFLTVQVFLYARKKFSREHTHPVDREIAHLLDVLFEARERALVYMLMMWPVMLPALLLGVVLEKLARNEKQEHEEGS